MLIQDPFEVIKHKSSQCDSVVNLDAESAWLDYFTVRALFAQWWEIVLCESYAARPLNEGRPQGLQP